VNIIIALTSIMFTQRNFIPGINI